MGMVVMSKRELNRLDVLARLDSARYAGAVNSGRGSRLTVRQPCASAGSWMFLNTGRR